MTQRDLTEEEELQAWEKMERRRQRLGVVGPLPDPKEPGDFLGDKAGWGRYILCFFLAGLFGLLAIHWARYYGYRGVWISLSMFLFIVIFLV